MSTSAHFRIDPKLTQVLGEKALKELVDNAWDADGSQKGKVGMQKNQTALQCSTSSFIIPPFHFSSRTVKGRKGIGIRSTASVSNP